MISDQNSSYGTDENHSIKSASDSILIDFYHKLREESVAMIFQYNKEIKVDHCSLHLEDIFGTFTLSNSLFNMNLGGPEEFYTFR
jgi:hypothetical protein